MSVAVHVDLRAALGPIRDQGPRPTCLAFATTAAHEYALDRQAPLSPEYLHFHAASSDPESGVSLEAIQNALAKPGQPSEAHCPYSLCHPEPGWMPPDDVPLFCCASKPERPSPSNLAALLAARHVPVLGITVPMTFLAPVAPWVIPAGGPVRGRHAVAAVGLGVSDSEPCFLIRNSWGPEWGDGGHVWLSAEFIGKHLCALLALSESAE